MKLRIKKAQRPVMDSRQRYYVIKDLLGKQMVSMATETAAGHSEPMVSNDALAQAVVDRLDPDRRTPQLLRLAAEQQILYHLNNQAAKVWRKFQVSI